MSFLATGIAKLVLVLLLPAAADIISDITTSESDESSALQIKAELFWKPILNAAEGVNMEKHLDLYAEAEATIKNIPAENDYVRQALREALDHLKSADEAAFKQNLASTRMAKGKLDAPCGSSWSDFSFLTGGQNFLRTALQRFVGGGRYPERLVKHVEQRQADILPVLRGAAGTTGSILSDCRLASKKGFDVQKYDIYNHGVPKTPKFVNEMADKIIDAAGETRHHFMKSITSVVKEITRDVQEQNEDPGATVTKASLRGLHKTIAKAEAELPSKMSLFSSSQILDV
jgi:hypothetical protein